jgi:hypothetical protein
VETAATVRGGSALAGEFDSTRACWETHSARASAIDLRVRAGACAGACSAAVEDGAGAEAGAGSEAGAGAEAGGAARANLSSALSLSSRRYQH